MTHNGKRPPGAFAVVGLGVVAGPQPDKSQRRVAAEAARLAIEDAGLERTEVDGAIDLRRSGGGQPRCNGKVHAFQEETGSEDEACRIAYHHQACARKSR